MSDTAPGGEPTTVEQTRVRYALHVVERAASQIARRFPGRARARELYAIGTFALYRAARDFRDELSHDFADYAYRRVRWAMLDELRALSKHERRARAAWKGGDLFLATYRDDDFNIFKHDTDEEVSRRLQSCVDDLLAATFAAMVEESQRIDAEVRREFGKQADNPVPPLEYFEDDVWRVRILKYLPMTTETHDMPEASSIRGYVTSAYQAVSERMERRQARK